MRCLSVVVNLAAGCSRQQQLWRRASSTRGLDILIDLFCSLQERAKGLATGEISVDHARLLCRSFFFHIFVLTN